MSIHIFVSSFFSIFHTIVGIFHFSADRVRSCIFLRINRHGNSIYFFDDSFSVSQTNFYFFTAAPMIRSMITANGTFVKFQVKQFTTMQENHNSLTK